MKKLFAVLVALLGLTALPAHAYDVKSTPLAVAFDLDGEAADADQVVVSANLADSTTYTIAAQPDTCRLIDLTITDANSSTTAGIVTVTGTDCWGDTLVATFDFSVVATRGSGVKTLSVASTYEATAANFATITSVVTGTLTGEEGAGTDLITVGYTSNSNYTYPIYGVRKSFSGHRFVDPFAYEQGRGTITVNGTAIASYATVEGGAFQGLAAGDMIYIKTGGLEFERMLTVVSSDDAATINAAIPSNAAPSTTEEVRFRYKKRYLLVEAQDAWIPVDGAESVLFIFDVDANASTGGVTSNIECGIFSLFAPATWDPVYQQDTANVATGNTGNDVTSVDLRLYPYTHCRAGIKFGTGDDGDSANEDINLAVRVLRESN